MLILNYTLVFIDLCVHMTFSHLQFGGKKKNTESLCPNLHSSQKQNSLDHKFTPKPTLTPGLAPFSSSAKDQVTFWGLSRRPVSL